MNSEKKERFIYRVIKRILNQRNQMERYELKNIIRLLLETEKTPFDAGWFFFHDQVENSFDCVGAFPEKFNNVKDEINQKLEKCKCKLDSNDLPESACGLYCVNPSVIVSDRGEKNRSSFNCLN